MHCHCGTNNRAPRWTFTDPWKSEVRPGAREVSASPAWLAAPAGNARDTTKVLIWRINTGSWLTLYRKCHSHNTPGKRHNNTWVEPLAGNCTTSSTRQREQVWQNCKIQQNWCTVTVVPAIEHHSGHSRTLENQRLDQVPGRNQCLPLGREYSRHKESVYMEDFKFLKLTEYRKQKLTKYWTLYYQNTIFLLTHMVEIFPF